MNYIGLQPVLVIFILKVTMAPERYFCNICGKNAEKDLIECQPHFKNKCSSVLLGVDRCCSALLGVARQKDLPQPTNQPRI